MISSCRFAMRGVHHVTFRVWKISSNFQEHGGHELWMFFRLPGCHSYPVASHQYFGKVMFAFRPYSSKWIFQKTSKISIKTSEILLMYHGIGGILRRWFLLTAVSESLRFFQSSPCGLEEHGFPRPALSYELASLILLIELAWACMKQHKFGQSIRVPVFVFIHVYSDLFTGSSMKREEW